MENLETKLHTILSDRLCDNLTHVTLTTFPEPSVFTLHHFDSQTTFYTLPFDLSSSPKPQAVSIDSKPIALTLHNESPLLICRDGSLISIQEHGPENLGEFTDENPERSGVLAAASSPDGCLLLVVSPVSVSILDADFDVNAEFPCDGIASDARVAWRSDGEFFVVVRQVGNSTVGLVADRACKVVKKLELENVKGEFCVDWEPRAGGLIAVSHDSKVLFYERNGLRHRRSDFDTGRNVDLLRWSGDARTLLIFGEGILDIWVKRNYLWYCKKRLSLQNFCDAIWDEDDPRLLRIFLSNGEVRILRFQFIPSTVLPVENGPLLAVTHGHSVIFTNLARGLVPPPMNHGHLTFHSGVEATCCLTAGTIGCLLSDGSFETAAFKESLGKPFLSNDPLQENAILASRNKWQLTAADGDATSVKLPLRAPVLIAKDMVAVVRQQKIWLDREMPNDEVQLFRLKQGEAHGELLGNYVVDGQVTSMCASQRDPDRLTIAISCGTLVHISTNHASSGWMETGRTPCKAAREACSIVDTQCKELKSSSLLHSTDGRLEIFHAETESSILICDDCTSFTTIGDFLAYTTRSNLMYCVPLARDLLASQRRPDSESMQSAPLTETNGGVATSSKEAIRPIDRGSVIVASLQDDISVAIQAPRGNLETVAPRPVVLNKVKKLVERENFGSAFALCRRQRIDMNYLVDADLSSFMKNVNKFVSQIGIAEHLSVFMTLLKGDTMKINTICQAVVGELRNLSDQGKYTSAIMTGMMRQEPPDFEGALKELKLARSTVNGQAAVDYLFVLVKNQELVYGHALGTYDLDLASFVAESSQMDPALYHPELRCLRAMKERECKTTIDLKLERYDRALIHLHSGGKKNYDQCVSLCLEHSLYNTGLRLFKNEEDIIKVLLNGYGNHLKSESRFDEAAAVFRQVGDNRSACDCYRLANRWQLAAYCAASSFLSQDDKEALWNSIATDLEENGRIIEAAQVRANFLGEYTTALSSLIEGEKWEAAFELVARGNHLTVEENGNPINCFEELSSEIVQSARNFKANLEENEAKLRDRRQRLATVRYSKQMMREHIEQKRSAQEADSDIFSETTASSISNLSDITFYSKTSATSLYSTATQTGPLSSAKLKKEALRRKQRESKKRIREGHPREEEAIVAYARKLFPTKFTQERTENFGRALLFVQNVDLASALTDAFRNYISAALSFPDDVVGEEKARLEMLSKGWTAGVPRAMVFRNGKVEEGKEDR